MSDESVDQETHNCINIRSTLDTSFIFQYISIDNVKLSLMNLKTNISSGLDKIPAKVLRLSADIISPSLTYIFNRSLETDTYIDDLKRARVIPQVAQAHEWFLVCLVFALDFENKFYFKYT